MRRFMCWVCIIAGIGCVLYSDSAAAREAMQQAERERACAEAADQGVAEVPEKRYGVYRDTAGVEFILDRRERRDMLYRACVSDASPPDAS